MGLFQEFEMHPRGTHPHTRRQELMKKPPRHCITRRLARSDGCFRSARLRPLEVRAQAFINWPSVIGLCQSGELGGSALQDLLDTTGGKGLLRYLLESEAVDVG